MDRLLLLSLACSFCVSAMSTPEDVVPETQHKVRGATALLDLALSNPEADSSSHRHEMSWLLQDARVLEQQLREYSPDRDSLVQLPNNSNTAEISHLLRDSNTQIGQLRDQVRSLQQELDATRMAAMAQQISADDLLSSVQQDAKLEYEALKANTTLMKTAILKAKMAYKLGRSTIKGNYKTCKTLLRKTDTATALASAQCAAMRLNDTETSQADDNDWSIEDDDDDEEGQLVEDDWCINEPEQLIAKKSEAEKAEKIAAKAEKKAEKITKRTEKKAAKLSKKDLIRRARSLFKDSKKDTKDLWKNARRKQREFTRAKRAAWFKSRVLPKVLMLMKPVIEKVMAKIDLSDITAGQDATASLATAPEGYITDPGTMRAFIKLKIWSIVDPQLQKLIQKAISVLFGLLDKGMTIIKTALSSVLAAIPFVGGFLAPQVVMIIDTIGGYIKTGITKALETLRVLIADKLIGTLVDAVFKAGEFIGVTQIAEGKFQNDLATKAGAAQASVVTTVQAEFAKAAETSQPMADNQQEDVVQLGGDLGNEAKDDDVDDDL